MKKDDLDFIDLDSTMNWSQLDVERELDNRGFDEETGKRLDYAKGFGDEGKVKEDDILLDGLTSGLNYIPEEFLMAAQEKKDVELEAAPVEEKPDVSWAYRTEDDEDDEDEPFIAIADLKEAERQKRAKENHEALVAKVNKNAENDAEIQANIEARRNARIEAEIVASNIAKANAAAKLAQEKEAEAALFADEQEFEDKLFMSDEEYTGPIMTKEERIAAANKNGHNVTAPIKSEEVKKASLEEIEYEDTVNVPKKNADDFVPEKKLSTGDTDVIYYDADTFEEINNEPKEYEEVVVKVKKKKKSATVASAAEEYAMWADSDDAVRPKKKKPSSGDKNGGKKPPKGGSGKKSSGAKKKKKNKHAQDESFWGRIFNFFENLTAIDYMVAGTGLLVVVAIIITSVVYMNSKAVKAQVAEFVPLGQEMQGLGTSGNSKLVAIADAKRYLATMEEEEEVIEEEQPVEYVEKEDETEGNISVTMSLTSVKKDLKIKFINAKTKKLVGNYVFEVEIETADGKKSLEKDSDKDGIIYLKDVTPGKAKVSMKAMPDEKNLTFSTEAVTVNIKENIEYKKIDVADEVKTESQVNAAKEDTAQGNATEATLKDTVEWVESTKTSKNGDQPAYIQVEASKIDNLPKESAKGVWANFWDFLSDSWCLKAYAACEKHEPSDEGKITKEATCTEAGERTYTCSVCGESYTETISIKEHTWGDDGKCTNPNCSATKNCDKHTPEGDGEITKKPTCMEKGEKTLKCKVCGESYKEDVEALGHKWANGKCSNEGCNATKGDESTELTCGGEKVYIDEKGSKVATYADYYANPNMKFYIKNTATANASGDEYIYTGWQEIDGKMYFYNKNGEKVTGEQVIQGAKYNFDSEGALMKGSGTLGIDVSKWNGNINWQAVKNSGVSYVIIRCGYRGSTTGALIEDPKFKSNIKGANDAGLKVGIYFYSQATTDVEAVEEASMTLDLIRGYKISYPVFLDVEGSGGRGDKIDAATRTTVINAYCQTIKNGGYTPGLYANRSWLETKINTGSLTSCKIWLAQYNTAPTYKGHYDLWQYSDKGSVGGISVKTDMNLSYLGY